MSKDAYFGKNVMKIEERLNELEAERHELEPTWVSFNPEIKQSTRDRLERVRLGLMDYRLHVLHSRPRLKSKRIKSLKLFPTDKQYGDY